MSEIVPIRTALISVSDKLGLADFAAGLRAAGVRLLSTGGTRKHLLEAGLDVEDVSSYTGFPEMMDGRLKTLHPKIHGGLLARRDVPEHLEAMAEQGMVAIDLVVVNLYPFEATVARGGVTREAAIEQIDIGGPSMLRSAAKNHSHVTVATRTEQYSSILEQIQEHGGCTLSLRRSLAWEAFELTSAYDRAIADYLRGDVMLTDFPPTTTISLRRKALLRYGANPHQKAALYADSSDHSVSLVSARQINGKELSYNNLLDLDAALNIVRSFNDPAAVVIKHNNPCGAASDERLARSAQKALDGDPVSAFGSVLGFNRTVDVATAEVLCQPGLFVEAIVAPDFEAGAVGLLTTKPKWASNVRLMQVGRFDEIASLHRRFISGGLLVQEADRLPPASLQWQTVTKAKVPDSLWDDLAFGWEMVRHVKSNAIVLAKDRSLVGVGAGQMSRVDSVEISIDKAGDRSRGSILASDAFFPFPDSIDAAAEAGIVAIIQPGGSRRDNEAIEACDRHNIAMVFTGRRHFKH